MAIKILLVDDDKVVLNSARRYLQGHGFQVVHTDSGAEAAILAKECRPDLVIPYLLETVWGYDPASYNDPHTVGVHVSSLRKKLGSPAADHITSVTGHG